MRPLNVLSGLAFCIALAGCASHGAPMETAGAAPDITVSNSYGVPADAQILGGVRGVSCAHSLLPDAATSAAALADLKREAARRGATGVSQLRNLTRGFSPSCVYSRVAEGLAYRVP